MFAETEEQVFEDGETIFDEGSYGTEVYRIKSGAVVISKEVGGRDLTMEVLRVGEIFGEMAVISDEARSAKARALGRTVVSMLDRGELEKRVSELPEDLSELFTCLVRRLKKTTDIAAGINLLRKEPRVSKTWYLHFEHPGGSQEAQTVDASSEGIFVKTPTPLERGERFLLKLQLPSREAPLEIESEVAWTRRWSENPRHFPLGMGVRFVKMSDSDRAELKAALHE
ncbi:MAG: cyclic nucleotide-binding domain-containing protein [Desulfatibacillaceae bacterium]